MVYREYHENLTTDAAVLFSYIRDVEPIMKDREGDYFRLSNSFIQELFWDWGSDKIKAKLDELVKQGYIDVQQKYKVERKSACKTRWIKITYNPEANTGFNTEANTEINTELNTDSNTEVITVKNGINNNIILTKATIPTKETIYDEASSSSNPPSKKELFSEEDTLSNCPDPSDKAEKYSAEINEIVAYLNEKTQSSYRTSTGNTRKHIVARLKQCYTVADFKYVIDVKCAEWLNDPKMAQYLRPETLFTERNFENYLQQKMPAAKTAARAGQPNTQYKQANLADLCDETY